MVEPNRWYTVQDIVDMLGVHEQTVRRWVKSGELAGLLLSNKSGYRVQGEALQAFLDDRTAQTGKAAA